MSSQLAVGRDTNPDGELVATPTSSPRSVILAPVAFAQNFAL